MKRKKQLILLMCLALFGCSSNEYEMSETDLFFANKYESEKAELGYHKYEKRIDGNLIRESKYLYVKFENNSNNQEIFNDHKFAYYYGKEICNYIADSFNITTEIPFEPDELRITFIKKNRFLFLNFDKEKTLEYEWNQKY